ncbi:hypothetical protein GF352_03665 [archaeon]|nr:hypothetical protein [archaeon]
MKYYDTALVSVPKWYGYTGNLEPVVITANNYSALRKKSKNKGFIVLKHPSKKVFRKAVEKSLVDAVLPDRLRGHDYFHHKKTLLNNVTAKLMSKNKVSLLFTFRELRNHNSEERALIWGRMRQEAWICLKKKVPIIISSWAEKKEELVGATSLLAMGELLGLKPEEAKQSLNHVQRKILERLSRE